MERQKEKLFQELHIGNENMNDLVNNYPNKSSLVINALLSCLADENTFVQRNTLDFMYTHLRLDFELFTEKEKKVTTPNFFKNFSFIFIYI